MLTTVLQNLRRHYKMHTLDESNVAASPFSQFHTWFNEALHAELPEPNAMTLATATPDARPSARVLLLKGFDEQGFVFYTNYLSRKGEELAANPHACLLFFWVELERQVRIEGTIAKVSRQESDEYFQSRPHGSRLGAWSSEQSSVVPNRQALEQRYADVVERFGENPVPLPDFWGGYRLTPTYFEFWQGRENRMHDRIAYTQHNNLWNVERLSP
ncbi:MAG: pyridoxamine 5'-phosphate oxidase [Candidatus Kapabacteria bacterium]|nr:pyridoxamine 5'-phosphate oxidase [Candidatus Kapabacteria bacterium]